MIHPGMLRFAELGEDDLVKLAEEWASFLSLGDILNQRSGFPDPPEGTGLFALVDPDGVTVRVVRGGVEASAVRVMVSQDVCSRRERESFREMVLAGYEPSRIFRALDDAVSRQKSAYRFERLADQDASDAVQFSGGSS